MQQKKIVRLHAQGCSMRKISKLLGLDRRTAKSYVKKYKASGIDPSELIKPEKDLRVPLCLDAQGKLMAMIHEQFKAGQLTLPKSMSSQDYTELKHLMYTKGFNVYAKKAFGGPDQVLEYLGRYTHKICISNHKILKMTKTHVTFRYTDRKKNQLKCKTICGVKFLKLFAEHILPMRFIKIRHIGFLAPRFKARNLKSIRKHLKVYPHEVIKYKNTRDFITATTGINPHLCPK